MILSGWGRTPQLTAQGDGFETVRELRVHLDRSPDVIVHARGRSYGDAALNANVLFSSRFDKLKAFDPSSGVVVCESGVTLWDLVNAFLPRGWFLAVTPGTRHVSVGGAIASDVHGKNHHGAGCFSEGVLWFDLMLPGGDIARCSREENADLFRATCGGMGLTGVILDVALRLEAVGSARVEETVFRCRSLEELLDRIDEHSGATHSVAWVDSLAGRSEMGRSALILGEPATDRVFELPRERSVEVPCSAPSFLLNRRAMRLFNHVYQASLPGNSRKRLVPLSEFFYPLDKVAHWNRLYGSRGFTQYQMVIPPEGGREGLKAVLEATLNLGFGPFLTVLKRLGPWNGNLLSFPMEGYTLCMDFKMHRDLFRVLDRLDAIVLDHGGRLYLTKDMRMSRETFRRGYPNWEAFAELRETRGLNRKFQSLQSRRLGV